MRRQLWGEFTEEIDDRPKEKLIPTFIKKAKLDEVQKKSLKEEPVEVNLKVKNALVTQTIEVMKQTEMLTSLIDTYSNKSDSSNYLVNPCQMIPEVDFPPENAADFVNDDKFAKPIWFIPPIRTNFTDGKPKNYPELTPNICRAALRKSVSGLLSMAGYTDTAESALILFTDAAEEFLKQFVKQIRDVHENDPRLELKNEIDINTLEKACCNHTNSSLTQIHNYFKHQIIAKNRNEIAEFNDVLQEYDKLMKESQNVQKPEFQNEGEFISIIEMPSTSAAAAAAAAAASGVGNNNSNPVEVNSQTLNLQTANIVNLLEGQHLPQGTTIKIDTLVEHEQNLAEQLQQYTNEAFLSNQD